ncbi:MAG: hypothetical protein RLZZ324_527 [Candidatus Parcubacteria bacterium]|jgi:hypothetical protein
MSSNNGFFGAFAALCVVLSACTGEIYDSDLLAAGEPLGNWTSDGKLLGALADLPPHPPVVIWAQAHPLLPSNAVLAACDGWWATGVPCSLTDTYAKATVTIMVVDASMKTYYDQDEVHCRPRAADKKTVLANTFEANDGTHAGRIHVYGECFWVRDANGLSTGVYNTDFVRIVLAHELGHTLGLPHDLRTPPVDLVASPKTTLYGVGLMNPFIDFAVQEPTYTDGLLYLCVYGQCGLIIPPESPGSPLLEPMTPYGRSSCALAAQR